MMSAHNKKDLAFMGVRLIESNVSGYSVFEYLYRDSGNYKVWGKILLTGACSKCDEAAIRECLDAGEYFVAEQVGVPALFAELWSLSGGRTSEDHAFHEFSQLRSATFEDCQRLEVSGSLAALLSAFEAASDAWICELSPNA